LKMLDVSHELFQFWVDMAETLKARVPSHMLLAMVRVIVEDAKSYCQACADRGEPVPSFTEAAWDAVWLCRWRKMFNLTPQSVNCKYVVSFKKVLMRLGVTWRNAARLLFLHEELYGAGRLEFITIDEKPFHFNANGADRVWARRGAKKKVVKEVRQALLERWTGMTSCSSKGCQPGVIPKWAALFKSKDGTRTHLRLPPGVKVQFARHGSYRTGN
jgi:hypothetical protein